MANHFDCIGVPSASEDQLAEFIIDQIASIATWHERAGGGYFLSWTDSSGAGLYLRLDENKEIQCLIPSFCGTQEHRVKLRAILPDESCRFCDILHVEVVDDDDQLFYPLLLQMEDVESFRPRVEAEKPALLRVTGFAESLESWPDEESFHASQAQEKAKFAIRSCAASGMFQTPWTAHMLMTGAVVESNPLTNSQSGIDFLHLHVETYGGIYDVVTPQSPAPMHAGMVVQCSCWMVGSVGERAI